MIDLSNKTILVTGGSRGIGAATVKTLVQAGAWVVLHYGRSHAEAAELAKSLNTERVYLVQGDLSQPTAATKVWQQALEWRGNLDVLVNNAGISPYTSPEDDLQTWQTVWQQTLQVNLLALADLCKAAIEHFDQKVSLEQPGIIINVSSRAAYRGDDPNMMHYAASKGAVVALTKSIARGYAHKGILAYGVAPGWVATEMAADYINAHQAEIARAIPIGSVAPAEEVANAIAFLASGLVKHMVGATLDINGASFVR